MKSILPNLYTYEYAYNYQAPRTGTYTVTAYNEADALAEVIRSLREINIMGRAPDHLHLRNTRALWN